MQKHNKDQQSANKVDSVACTICNITFDSACSWEMHYVNEHNGVSSIFEDVEVINY